MSNQAVVFAENLSIVANVTALTIAALNKVSHQEDVELNAASRDLMVARIQSRLANNLRSQQRN
jgi:hypothetical protein